MIIAEIGINHNGDMGLAKELIDGAVFAGADAVKFQKRDIDIVYTKEYLDSKRNETMTQREQKESLEFGKDEYDEINEYCKDKIDWFASAWDIHSLKFLSEYNCKSNKVASAMLTNIPFLTEVAKERKYTFISTGMSRMKEITRAVEIFEDYDCPYEILHCNSSYPAKTEDINLNMIKTLQGIYGYIIGYSGHELGIAISCAAVALGASTIERHITLDRAMEGSDQSASLEIMQFHKMVKSIRAIKKAMGDGKKVITDNETEIKKKLRYFE